MSEIEELINRFYLRSDTYKPETGVFENWGDLIKREDFWEKIRCFSSDTAELKTFLDEKGIEERNEYLRFGIACFMYFIQCNYTGPKIPETIDTFLNSDFIKKSNFTNNFSVNAEEININTKHLILLKISELMFDHCVVHDVINAWWSLRALMIHQDILEELSSRLFEKAKRLTGIIENFSLKGLIKAELEIEMAQMYRKFLNVTKCKNYIKSAKDILGLEYNLVGKMGKRTKFQTKEVAQLSVEITLAEREAIERVEVEDIVLPQNFNLNDEVILDHVSFTAKSEIMKLPSTEQKLVLLLMQYTLRATPYDELHFEEIVPFHELLLNQKNTYAVRVAALLIRCNLECQNRRTVERSLKQYEDILSFFNQEAPPSTIRIGDVFATSFPPVWKIKALHAKTLLAIGLVKASLDIYLDLELWEEVIVCYTILNLREKAAEVIRTQLEIKPTVKMMCLLGDATDDESCYEKAWDMSHGRSPRAQRHWANFLFNQKEYLKSVPHFEKSVNLNPLQPKVWIRLGYAALQAENWQMAATAYRRYVSLEPDAFEAWNNLAQACLKLGNKHGAHQAIQEAIKCDFENWKLWENLLLISHDILNFSELIRAYHRLIDLNDRYLNVEILQSLVYGVCSDAIGSDHKPLSTWMQKTRELMGRITTYSNHGTVWVLYANLAPTAIVRAQRLQRSYNGYKKDRWDISPASCCQVLTVCYKLGETVLDDEIDRANPIIRSVKLNIESALKIAKDKDHYWENYPDVVQLISDSYDQLKLINEKISVVNN